MSEAKPTPNVLTFLRGLLRDHLVGRASLVAGSIAFFAMLSLAPLAHLGVALAGVLVGTESAKAQLMAEIAASVGDDESVLLRELLRDAVTVSGSGSVWTTITSFVVMSFGAMRLFVALQRGLNQIWHVPRPDGNFRRRFRVVLHKRALAYVMALGSGLAMLLVVLVRLLLVDTIAWLRDGNASALWVAVDLCGSFALLVLVFAAVYRVLPDALLSWRDIMVGAVATAVLYSLGLVVLRHYLHRAVPQSPTGGIAMVTALLIWLYYSAHIFLLGAQFTWQWARQFGAGVTERHEVPGGAEPN